jgi:ATP-binding protein involved in chromosome partitioning
VALADARKGVAMFTLPNINVPVLGLVENMAWFTPEELPENKYFIFGKDGVKKLADELNLSLLGQIPLVQRVRESGDKGVPAALEDSNPASVYFTDLAEQLIHQVHLIHQKSSIEN